MGSRYLKGRLVTIFASILIPSLPLFLLLTNIRLFASPSLIKHEYRREGFPEAEYFSPEERLSMAKAVVFYLRSEKDVGFLRDLKHAGQPVFNERELAHLVDVKVWIKRAFAWEKIFALLTGTSLLFSLMEEKARKRIPLYVASASLITISLIGSIGLFAYLSFDWFFTRFHQLFFAAGTWIFDPSDALIQLFPVPFWFDAARNLALLTIGEALMLGLGMWGWQLRAKG